MSVTPPAVTSAHLKSATGVGVATCQRAPSENVTTRTRTWAFGFSAAVSYIAGSASRIAKFSSWIFSPAIDPEQSSIQMK